VPVIRPVLGPGGLRYPAPIEDFSLTRVQVDVDPGVLTTPGPQVVLCTEGTGVLTGPDGEVVLTQGQSAFVPAGQPVTARGPAVLYRSTTALR
jgi:mannose-6-phosphate isomerase